MSNHFFLRFLQPFGLIVLSLSLLACGGSNNSSNTSTDPDPDPDPDPDTSAISCRVFSGNATSDLNSLCLNFDGFRTLVFTFKDQDEVTGTASDDEFVLSVSLDGSNVFVEVGREPNNAATSTEENTETIHYTISESLYDFPVQNVRFLIERVNSADVKVPNLDYAELQFEIGEALFGDSVGYLKAFACDPEVVGNCSPFADAAVQDRFGYSIALSGDGLTMVVGATGEDSIDNSIPAPEDSSNRADNSGAAYIYAFDAVNNVWAVQQRLKPMVEELGIPDVSDILTAENAFGHAVAISENGNTIAVGAHLRDAEPLSGETALRADTGAVYIYEKNVSDEWEFQQMVEASTDQSAGDQFGEELALSNDGNTLVVGAFLKDSETVTETIDSVEVPVSDVGAAYIFTRTASVWTEQEYIELASPVTDDNFGNELSISGDGQRIAISAFGRDLPNPSPVEEAADLNNAGSVFVYSTSDNWATHTLEQEITAWHPSVGDAFGSSLALDDDGDTLAIGAQFESGSAPADMNYNDESAQQTNLNFQSGAAFVFTRSGATWTQDFYIKPSFQDVGDNFGFSVDLSADGNTLAVGAIGESGNYAGVTQGQAPLFDPDFLDFQLETVENCEDEAIVESVDGDYCRQLIDESLAGALLCPETAIETVDDIKVCRLTVPLDDSGAAYLFSLDHNNATWQQTAYIKGRNLSVDDLFGWNVQLADSTSTLLVSSPEESGAAPEQAEDSAPLEGEAENVDSVTSSGAVYFY